MTVVQAIILGIVQGITEFLPISSSGHLIIFPEIFSWPQQTLDFDVAIHLATLAAILWVLRNDVVKMVRGVFLRKQDIYGRLSWKIVIATLPVIIVGVLIGGFLDQIRNVEVVVATLAVWGVILWIADETSKRKAKKVSNVQETSWSQAMLIGLCQALALIPGTSRAGVTISAGLFTGLDRPTAARFSFLLAIPAIAGAGVLVAFDVVRQGLTIDWLPLIVGFAAAFFSGALAIKFLLKLVEKVSYKWFAVYRIALAVIILIFFVV